jgi:hypothetical protein
MTVGAGTEQDDTVAGLQTSSCNYGPASSTISVALTVNCDPMVKNGQDVYDLLPSLYGGGEMAISGMGEAAFWLPGGDDAGTGTGTPKVLIVYFGGYSNFTVTILSSTSTTVNAQDVAQQLATIVAHNLMI